jgi:isoquinoline 1-oxidoreductase beta subunit
VPVASLKAEQGVISGAGKSAGFGEFFEAAMKLPVPEAVTLKDPKNFRLIGQPTTLTVAKAKSTGAQAYGMDVDLPGMLVAVVQRAGVQRQGGQAGLGRGAQGQGREGVLPVTLDRGGQGVAVVATATGRPRRAAMLKIDWDLAGVAKPDTTQLTAEYLKLAKTPGTPAPKPEFQADVSGWSKAPRKIVADFVFPYLNHAQMEPLACTVDLKPTAATSTTRRRCPASTRCAGAHRGPARAGADPRADGRRRLRPPRHAADGRARRRGGRGAGPAGPAHAGEGDLEPRGRHQGRLLPPMTTAPRSASAAANRRLAAPHRQPEHPEGLAAGGFGYQKGVDGTTFEGMREPYEFPMNLSVHHPDVNVPVLWWRSVGPPHGLCDGDPGRRDRVLHQAGPGGLPLKLMEGNAKAERHRRRCSWRWTRAATASASSRPARPGAWRCTRASSR